MSTKGLKEIRKFVQQAKKVEKRFPSISYYCRMAAVLKAMQIKEKTDEEKAALNELLGWLESNKVGHVTLFLRGSYTYVLLSESQAPRQGAG